jgi:hypothetical protein
MTAFRPQAIINTRVRIIKSSLIAPPRLAPRRHPFPNIGFSLPSYTPSREQYEIEGLTRNPDDCAKWGCIGNN